MSKVFVNIGLSLDGYMAPEGMTIANWSEPDYKSWGAKWGSLMSWVLKQQYFQENLLFSSGGETGPVNDMLRYTMERSGASIMGKRMFEQARESAGGRDIRISGGADVIQQYLNIGVIEKLEIALAPVLFGSGRRLFENMHEALAQFRIDNVLNTPDAVHLSYVRA
jgi:dihydrofolate reductase